MSSETLSGDKCLDQTQPDNANGNESSPKVTAPLPQCYHVGHLPSSFLSILPKTCASDMIAVVPQEVLDSTQLQHNAPALVNHRIATLYSAHRLLSANATPTGLPSIPSIVLLSPCLYAALAPVLAVNLHAVPTHYASPSTVTLSVLYPISLPSLQRGRAANLAKKALLQRDVHQGDLIPVSKTLWLIVRDVMPASSANIVTPSTNVALHLARLPPAHRPRIPHYVRNWVRAKWLPVPEYAPQPLMDELSVAVDAHLPLILADGLPRDVDVLVQHAALGRPFFRVVHATRDAVVDAFARAELVCRGGVVVVRHLSPAFVDALLSLLARREPPLAHLGVPRHARVTVLLAGLDADDVDVRLMQQVAAHVRVPKADESQRALLLEAGFARRRTADSPAFAKSLSVHLPELLRLSAGFARRDVFALGKLAACSGIETCREAARAFGSATVTIDAGGVGWGDIGGLEHAKKEIAQLLNVTGRAVNNIDNKSETSSVSDMVEATSAVPRGNSRVGVLLYGPPGTGKTLLARAVAGECGCSFLSVKGPELLDMYVGESERNVRDVFERAILSAPTVVFFDELDALAPKRGSAADSGRVSDRVVSQLLSEMDELAHRGDVFIIAASNRPDLVDAALLRPGRLDKLLYVPMPAGREEQDTILRAQTRKFVVEDGVHIEDVLEFAPEPPLISGADLYALAAGAWMKAAKRLVGEREAALHDSNDSTSHISEQNDLACWLVGREGELLALESSYNRHFSEDGEGAEKGLLTHGSQKDQFKNPVAVAQRDFECAARELSPSLTLTQLYEYEQLRLKLESTL